MVDIGAFEELSVHDVPVVHGGVPLAAVGGAPAREAVPRPVLDRQQRLLLRCIQTYVRTRSLQND